MTRARIALATATLFAVTLTTCSGDPTAGPSGGNTDGTATTSAASPSDAASSPDPLPTGSLAPSENLDAITVSDADVPEVTVPTPWTTSNAQTEMLYDSSSAQVVSASSTVTVDYVGVNGRTGAVFDSSFQRGKKATFSMGGAITGFKNGLTGQKVGSRVLIDITGADGYAQGNPQVGIQTGDSLVFVVDIIATSYDKAAGGAVTPAAGLPAVTMTEGKPKVTLPKDGVNAEQLVAQPLIKGPGRTVEADSTISVEYRAWRAKFGKMILGGQRGAQSGKLSTLINGWKTSLLGQTAGSWAMFVVPSTDSFPSGEPSKGLEAGEGLVYVIDILDVKAASQQNWRNHSPSR